MDIFLYLCSILKEYGTRRTVKENAAQTAVREDGESFTFFNGSILEYEQRSVSFSTEPMVEENHLFEDNQKTTN